MQYSKSLKNHGKHHSRISICICTPQFHLHLRSLCHRPPFPMGTSARAGTAGRDRGPRGSRTSTWLVQPETSPSTENRGGGIPTAARQSTVTPSSPGPRFSSSSALLPGHVPRRSPKTLPTARQHAAPQNANPLALAPAIFGYTQK